MLNIGRGPTPMLYYTATAMETGGAIMVTGSHNPPDYNGFKMMLGRKPFFGAQIQEIGRMAREGDVVPESAAPTRTIDMEEEYVNAAGAIGTAASAS